MSATIAAERGAGLLRDPSRNKSTAFTEAERRRSAWSAAPRIKMYWFGLFEWPRIGWIMDMAPVAKKAAHAELFAVHQWLGYALYVLFFLHVGGALKHQFIDKQPELQRMS